MSGASISIKQSEPGSARPRAAGSGALPGAKPGEDALRTATHLRLALGPEERSLAITGLEVSDGAAALALEVAAALALLGQAPVVLLTATPDTPQARTPGLAEVLEDDATLDQALHESAFAGLSLLPAGGPPGTPLAAFSMPEYGALLTALEERFRYVVVDAGPLRRPESLPLIARCDAVAVALAEGLRRRRDALEAQQEIARLKARRLGVILTRRK